MTHHPDLELLARNLQIFEDKRTLGAFDFLIRLATGQVEHWEVAVKFYLLDGHVDVFEHWMGPNRRDRLDIKVTRMAQHQLPLSSHPSAANALAKLNVQPSMLSTRALLKGLLFHPLVSEDILTDRAYWVRQTACLQTVPHPEYIWQPRHKPDWIGPASHRTPDALTDSEFRHRLRERRVERPEMWSVCQPVGPHRLYELSRYFLVQDHWGRSVSHHP